MLKFIYKIINIKYKYYNKMFLFKWKIKENYKKIKEFFTKIIYLKFYKLIKNN